MGWNNAFVREVLREKRDAQAERAIPKGPSMHVRMALAEVPRALVGHDPERVAELRRTTKEDWAQ